MNYRIITTERQFKDSTGYSKEKFNDLLADYEKTYQKENGLRHEIYIEENADLNLVI